MKTAISFLIAAALLVGTVGCVAIECDLTVESTAGGSVTTPGNGTSAYYEGAVVDLVATPDAGYRFVNWIGDVDTVADVSAASTTVIVKGSYMITANFEEIRPVQYDLSISSTIGGSVTEPGEGTLTYDEDEVVDLVAEADGGYRFVNWSGNVGTLGSIETASTSIAMNGDYSIVANFEEMPPDRYSLAVSSTDGGAAAIPGDGTFTYDEGEVVDLVAEAEPGYRFVIWTGDVSSIADVEAASTTILVSGDYSITASFEPIPPVRYDLTITSTSGGTVITPGTGTFVYDAGMVIDLMAAAATGYQFVGWTGDVAGIAEVTSAATTIIMSGSYSIRANFEQVAPTSYLLSLASTAGGSITTPGEGTYLCTAGMVISLTATPASGYQFVNWTGDVGTVGNANAASTTITMNGSYSIRANFEQISAGQFNLTTSSTTGGSVNLPGEGTFAYDAGTVVSLTATPASGYQFVNWTGDVGTVGNVNAASTTITMNGGCSIRANFTEEPSSPPGVDYTTAEAEALIIVLVDNERQSFGLSALSEDALLTSLAREHSISMVENGFFGHERYPGERSFNYGQQPGTIRGENLAKIPTRRTYPGPYLSLQEVCEWAVSAWMGSSGHRANILEPRYTITGVGVSFSTDGNYLYITQIFEGHY